jgi:hypothetical protein
MVFTELKYIAYNYSPAQNIFEETPKTPEIFEMCVA